VLDEQGIERNPVTLGYDFSQASFGLFRGARTDHAKPVRDAVDMGVDRNRRDTVTEHKDAVRGLRSDSRERNEFVVRPRDPPVETVPDRAGAVSDHAGLNVIESRRAD
jgi:hypothetical protein